MTRFMDVFFVLAIVIVGTVFFVAIQVSQEELDKENELKDIGLEILDEGYFLLTTQDGMTDFNTIQGCNLRETYLEKYQHDWTNQTMKHMAYDMWINECLTKEFKK